MFLGYSPKGSHVIMNTWKFWMNAKNTMMIPVHPRKDVKPGLIRVIMKDVGLSREVFFKLLKGK